MLKIVESRWADSTNSKYKQAWYKWQEWCTRHPESPSKPADPFYMAVYINDLVLRECKIGTLEAAVAGIRWGHIKDGLPNPGDNILVKTVLEGAKRTVGKTRGRRQKEPFTTDMVKKVVLEYGDSSNLLHHRLIVICLLGFAGFLRIGELLQIQMGNMTFTSTHLEITIPKAKNDQIREGHVVHISRTASPFCPVSWTEKYIHKTDLAKDADNYLICRLSKTKSGHKADGRHNLSDTTVRDQFVKEVLPICQKTEPGEYSLHSFRSGGASTAINNGVSERLLGKHGRWKSGYSRDRYLKDSKAKRLSVSLSLCL